MYFRTACLFCDSRNLEEVIDLGMHPFADTFIPKDRLAEPDKMYPLICDLCKDCGNVQSRTITNPLDRYQDYDYSYTSSNSQTARKHWTEYASEVLAVIGTPKTVLEIGSNDGFLAEQFKTRGCNVMGIDASPAMAQLSRRRGIETLVGVFGLDVILGNERFDLICANNVFNHSDTPRAFVDDIANHLADDGVFVLEMPYWWQSVWDQKFDQIYHEHVTYLSVTSAVKLFGRAGLEVFYAQWTDYHGGSIRLYVGRPGRHGNTKAYDELHKMLQFETNPNNFEIYNHRRFAADVKKARNRFNEKLFSLTSSGEHIVCAGAAAKANTFLNYYRLDNTVIDGVTDSSPFKIGKWTPGSRIPIFEDAYVMNFEKLYVVVTSWNLYDNLSKQLTSLNPHIEFLNPFDPYLHK